MEQEHIYQILLKNVNLYPDPAFTIKCNKDIHVDFELNNTVGINVSKLILDYDKEKKHALNAYKNLII